MNDPIAEYWDRQPCNILYSKAPIGSLQYSNEVIVKKNRVEPHISSFANFNSYKGKKVLEVGCGIGTAAIQFLQAGAEYTGIDISQKSLDIARQRLDVHGLQGTLLKFNISKYKLAVSTYDLVYSFGVIHHIPDYTSAVKNIYLALKPHAEFKLMLYAQNSWKSAMIDAGLDQFEAQSNCPLAKRFTIQEINSLLNKFSNILIDQDHIFPYKIGPYKNNIYELEDWFKAMPEKVFRALEKRFGWHYLISCRK